MARLLRRLGVVAGAAGAARQYAKKHPDKVDRWLEKAGTFVDRRTKGKYHAKINKAVRKAQSTAR
jgi:hypothetical protein